jgi:acyl carrier protein
VTHLPPTIELVTSALAKIGLPERPTTPDTPLASCGLDSLMTVFLVVELEKSSGRRLTAEQILGAQPLNVASLAALLEAGPCAS